MEKPFLSPSCRRNSLPRGERSHRAQPEIQHGSFLAARHQCRDVPPCSRKPGILLRGPVARRVTRTCTSTSTHEPTANPLTLSSSSTVRAYTLSEIITIGVVAAVLVVAVVGGVIACAVRARSFRSAEALEPLLGDTFRRYSEDDRRFDKSQSVV